MWSPAFFWASNRKLAVYSVFTRNHSIIGLREVCLVNDYTESAVGDISVVFIHSSLVISSRKVLCGFVWLAYPPLGENRASVNPFLSVPLGDSALKLLQSITSDTEKAIRKLNKSTILSLFKSYITWTNSSSFHLFESVSVSCCYICCVLHVKIKEWGFELQMKFLERKTLKNAFKMPCKINFMKQYMRWYN